MKSFKSTALLEALKIVKRADRTDPYAGNAAQEPKKKKSGYDPRKSPLYVGDVNGLPVVKSKHTQEIRAGEKKSRDRNIKDELILKVLNKMMATGEFKPNVATMLIYKNTKGRFDLLVVKQEGNTLVIITFIQERKKDPYDYFTNKRSRDKKIVVESEFEIELDEELGDIIIIKDDLEEITEDVGVLAGIATSLGLIGITTAVLIDFATKGDNYNGKGDVTNMILKKIKDYKNKKFGKNVTKEEAEQLMKDIASKKEKLSGGQKGAITKLQNELEKAFSKHDEKEVGRILRKYTEKLTSEE